MLNPAIQPGRDVRFRVQSTCLGTEEVVEHVFLGRLRALSTAEDRPPKTRAEIELAHIETSPGSIVVVPVLDIVEVVS
jgi:hypothetical protein